MGVAFFLLSPLGYQHHAHRVPLDVGQERIYAKVTGRDQPFQG